MEKKGCDPGWNDPPLFSYESQKSQLRVTKPRTVLNKRVAFPLNEASPPATSFIPPVDPTAPLPAYSICTISPPPSEPLVLAKENSVPCDEKKSDSQKIFNPSLALETVLNNLCDVLNSKFENNEKDKHEINRRIEIMKKLWNEGKLCEDVQQKLLLLSEALNEDDKEKADDLQKGLMVDHAPACSPWMSGVRQLIHHRELDTRESESSQ